MDSFKNILIISPIGWIRWLKAPEELSEIFYHLSKTFNVPSACMSLFEANLGKNIDQDSYSSLLSCDWDIALKLEIDYTLKEIYGSKPMPESSDFKPKGPSSGRKGPQEDLISFDDPISSVSATSAQSNISDPPNARTPAKVQRRTNAKVEPNVKRASNVRYTPVTKILPQDEKKMQEGLKGLIDFGFTDTNKNKAALVKANYNFEEALEILLSK
jgi:hypothetical protein